MFDTAISALRLELRPGEWVLWDTRPHRFEILLGDRAQLRDPTTAELREVFDSEIRGLPCLPQIDFDARMETARTTDAVRWAAAESRETIIRAYLDGDGTIGTRLRAAADALGVSPRTIRRLVARYRHRPRAWCRGHRGRRKFVADSGCFERESSLRPSRLAFSSDRGPRWKKSTGWSCTDARKHRFQRPRAAAFSAGSGRLMQGM
jgi:hypothetical protein